MAVNTFTLRNVHGDFSDWHKGRTHYALWALPVDSPAVHQRLQAAQAHLSAWLLPLYQRQAHITVGLCGFPSPEARQADDFGPAALGLQLAALRQTAVGTLDLQVGGLASFSSVPYLRVQTAPAPLQHLRQSLTANTAQDGPADYTPHVTVGLYAGEWPLSLLHAAFERFGDTEPLPLRARTLDLVSYAPAVIGGPLQTLARLDLHSGALCWSKDLPASLQAFAAIG